jgi:hypothetical protein
MLSKISVTNFSRFICIHTLKYVRYIHADVDKSVTHYFRPELVLYRIGNSPLMHGIDRISGKMKGLWNRHSSCSLRHDPPMSISRMVHIFVILWIELEGVGNQHTLVHFGISSTKNRRN